MSDAIDIPGSVIIENVNLIVSKNGENSLIDLKPFCLTLDIHEDMFYNTMTGSATILDSGGIISKYPFSGAEYIQVSVKTPGFEEKIEKMFYITSVHNRKFPSETSIETYILDFISSESQLNKLNIISQKFSGTTTDIIKNIFDKYLKVKRNVNDVRTVTKLQPPINSADIATVSFVAPNWNPFKIINWLAARTYVSQTDRPDFLFFESNKKFYFESVDALIRKFKDNRVVFSNYIFGLPRNARNTQEEQRYNFIKPGLSREYSIVSRMTPFQVMDVFKSHDSGHYASKLSDIDITTKKISETSFDYVKDFKKFRHIEGENFPLVSSENLLYSPDTYRNVFFSTGKLHRETISPLHEKWALQRNSLIHDLFSLKMNILVPGRTDIEVGYVINFLYPKNETSTQVSSIEQSLDPYISGLYIITAIKHIITPSKHMMLLEIAKDSSSYKIG